MPTLTPDVELPDTYEPYPEELIIKCHESYRGLMAVHVAYRKSKDDFDTFLKIRLKDHKPQPSETPHEKPEEICELAMRCIEYDREETARRGEYRIQFHRQTSKGLRRQSILITTKGTQDPVVVREINKADEVELAHGHIADLYEANMNLIGVVTGIVNPLLHEFKNMTAIVSEMSKNSAEVRSIELLHALKMREIQQDEQVEVARLEAEKAKWDQLFDHVRETGALEAVVGGVMTYMQKKQRGKSEVRQAPPTPPRSVAPPAPNPTVAPPTPPPGPSPTPQPGAQAAQRQVPATTVKDLVHIPKEEPAAPAPEGRRRKTRKKSERAEYQQPEEAPHTAHESETSPAEQDASAGELEQEIDKEARYEQLKQEAMEMDKIVLIAQMLRHTIDDNKQWKEIYATLDKEQGNLFDTILSSHDSDEIYGCLEALASTNIGNLLMLRRKLTEEQRPMIDMLTQAAINGPEALEGPEDEA